MMLTRNKANEIKYLILKYFGKSDMQLNNQIYRICRHYYTQLSAKDDMKREINAIVGNTQTSDKVNRFVDEVDFK
ncbi:hypothetical protein [Staphylococcus haemolyticus]|uniref:hypothetical protein n=1 Tax=Staphylococcus haemolyticus TaxID=1283 RepID=UPI001F0B5CC9|nr:hypothetical protein [Staphylococcus haemolyticus]MCH4446775.1 hypothetical protein [Staphylococcus haemolyticus]HER6579560.1 hypothetical protein [Streptococcus pyogenes]